MPERGGVLRRDADAGGVASTGVTVGTWAYIAPERFRTGTVDVRSDIYSLTCVLYELLTGQPPFSGNTLTLYRYLGERDNG